MASPALSEINAIGIVDDVLTTGATIREICKEIIKVNETIEITIFTLGVANTNEKTLNYWGGLAGCALAYRLIKKGHHVRLIDNNLNKSSFVAAGMINPIVFRRVNKSWRVDDFLPSAIHFYNELQEETKVDFFSSIKIRRFFASEQVKKYWTQKQENPSYVKYLANPDEGHYPYSINKHKLGSGIVKNAYRVNAMSFMSSVHRMLNQWRYLFIMILTTIS